MAVLPRTEQALADLVATERIVFGEHDGEDVRVGHEGVYVGERPYDPARDDVSQINPLSVWAPILGEPHVALRIPERPIRVNVVTQERQAPENDRLGTIPAKRLLATALANTLYDAMPGITDRVFQYAVGEAAEEVKDPYVEVLSTNGDPLVDAKTTAELCRDGLTFVISDFLALPLETQAGQGEFPVTTAIRAMHKFDYELPVTDGGRIGTGINDGEINMSDPVAVGAVNAEMAAARQRSDARLHSAGLAVAHVILQPEARYGFETIETDRSIADAVSSISRR